MDRTTTPTTVILLGWGGANVRQLGAYRKLYRHLNLSTISFVLPITELMSGTKVNQSLIELTQRLENTEGAFIVHAFSNMGFGILSTLFHFEQNESISRRIRGVILDSGPGFESPMTSKSYSNDLMRAVSSTMSVRHTESNRLVRLLNRSVSRLAKHAAKLHYYAVPVVSRHYGDAVNRYYSRDLSASVLLIIGSDDEVIPSAKPKAFIKHLEQEGKAARIAEFEASPHVSHYREHPRRYKQTISDFLYDLNIN